MYEDSGSVHRAPWPEAPHVPQCRMALTLQVEWSGNAPLPRKIESENKVSMKTPI